MRRSAPAVATALLAVLALALAGCTSGSGTAEVSSTPPADKVLKLAFLQDPGQPPDPDVFYAGQGLVLTQNVYEGLLQYAPGTEEPTLAPALATAWQANSDNTVFTLDLRSGVTFHDGTPFDSSAVKPSFDRRLAVGQGPAYMVSQVKSVETPSPTQVVITLNAPDPAFLSYLASPYGPRMMSPTALAANAGSDDAQTYLATHDAGTGPYELTEAKVGEEYTLKAYSGYWGDEPYFTEVDFPVLNDLSALQVQFNSGELHAILYGLNSSASTSYQGSDAVTNYALPALQTEQVYVNPNKGFLTTAANRTALLQAIDYEKIREQVYGGRSATATGNYPANLLPEGASPQDITYDTSALAAVVASLPADQKSLAIGYTSSDADEAVVANLIATELQALGLTATVQGLTPSQVFGYVGTDGQEAPNVYIASAWPDSAEAYAWAHIIYDGSGGLNYLSCSDPALTAAIAQAATVSSETDPATWGAIGVQALATGCWANLAYRQDFMVGQKWLTGVEEAHVVTAPTSLLLAKLGVAAS